MTAVSGGRNGGSLFFGYLVENAESSIFELQIFETKFSGGEFPQNPLQASPALAC